MDEMLTSMLNALFSFDTSSLDNLSKNLGTYNSTAYGLVTRLHGSAVVPVSSVVISIVLVLELARNASHIEGDHQMGAKIIAGTMFKSALLIIAAQNSMLFLDAINEVSSLIISGLLEASSLPPCPPDLPPGSPDAMACASDLTTSSSNLPPGLTDSISEAGNVDKAGMLMLLIVPFLVALVGKIVVQVMVVLRFAELYMMTAFASLPIALLGHPETKSMGVGYLQRYASVSLQGATLMLAVAIYKAVSGVSTLPGLEDGQSLSGWIVSSYPQLLLAPVLLIILVMASGRLAKAVVGQ